MNSRRRAERVADAAQNHSKVITKPKPDCVDIPVVPYSAKRFYNVQNHRETTQYLHNHHHKKCKKKFCLTDLNFLNVT